VDEQIRVIGSGFFDEVTRDFTQLYNVPFLPYVGSLFTAATPPGTPQPTYLPMITSMFTNLSWIIPP
jgi:hypothetical protein